VPKAIAQRPEGDRLPLSGQGGVAFAFLSVRLLDRQHCCAIACSYSHFSAKKINSLCPLCLCGKNLHNNHSFN
jgi:hypothetical protein